MSERKEYMNLAWEIATKLSAISDEERNEILDIVMLVEL